MREELEQEFLQNVRNYGLDLSEDQLGLFASYYQLLIKANEQFNLTAITEAREVYIKHFFDSLSIAKFIIEKGNYRKGKEENNSPGNKEENYKDNSENINLRLIDIGSGAGFPGIPLKIFFPNLEVTFLDSLNKRINFLRETCVDLGLPKCFFVHGRAEDLGQDPAYRESYDLTTARAVAKLSVLNELASPFLKQGGRFIAMKGPDADQEIVEAGNSMRLLNLSLVSQTQVDLPDSMGERRIVILEKTGSLSKKYPRKAGTPARKPL